jgi:hypothetical protein
MAKGKSEKVKKEKKERRSETDGVTKSKKDKKSKLNGDNVAAALEETLVQSAASVVEMKAIIVKESNGELAVKPVGALVPFANPLADDKVAKKVLKSVKKGTAAQSPTEIGGERRMYMLTYTMYSCEEQDPQARCKGSRQVTAKITTRRSKHIRYRGCYSRRRHFPYGCDQPYPSVM